MIFTHLRKYARSLQKNRYRMGAKTGDIEKPADRTFSMIADARRLAISVIAPQVSPGEMHGIHIFIALDSPAVSGDVRFSHGDIEMSEPKPRTHPGKAGVNPTRPGFEEGAMRC
jgi:hypothetical protein